MGKAILTTSIDIEISVQLDKLHINKSELVNRLLNNYLNTFTPEQLEAEIKNKTEILEKHKETIHEKEALTQAKKDKVLDKRKEQKDWIKKSIKEEFDIELSDSDAEDYVNLLEADLTNYYKFVGEIRKKYGIN